MSDSDSPRADAAVKPARWISVQTRITFLWAITAAAFIVFLLAIQDGWRRQVDVLLHERALETDRVVRRVLELRAGGATTHADDYTRWDDFVTFTHRQDADWGSVNLTQNIATFQLDIAWVLDDHFRHIFTANPENDSLLAPLPLPESTLAMALRAKPIRHFFVRRQKQLLEVWTSPIQPSDDFERKTPIHGYYIIGRVWTAPRIAELARDANARVHLVPAEGLTVDPLVAAQTGTIKVAVPLPGIDISPAAMVLFTTTYPLLASVHNTLRMSALTMIAGVICITLAVGWALRHRVAHPLATITRALQEQQPSLLSSLPRRQDELGRLAHLVEEFFQQREKLIEAREAATVAMATKSQFLANISHELRTPMHGILSYSRFGLQGAMTAKREELLDDFKNIESCGTSLLSLLDDLLDLAKLEAGRMRFDFAPALLEQIVADAADEFASFYHEKSLRVDIRGDDRLEPAVVDRRKILQVMRNLLSNSGKFTPPGGTVSVRMATAEGRGRVTVEDSGAGIPQDELDLIFEKFAQASNIKRQAGGTGLGLAICREIVEAHGGRIWAENRAEGGARISFEVPLEGPPSSAEHDILRPKDAHEQHGSSIARAA